MSEHNHPGKTRTAGCPACLEYSRAYRAANRARMNQTSNATMAKQRAANPQKFRDIQDNIRHSWTPADRIAFETANGNACGICGTTTIQPRGWHIDHDHRCCPAGKSCAKCRRGILCSPCNTGLGLLQDSPEVLLAAVAYLTKAR